MFSKSLFYFWRRSPGGSGRNRHLSLPRLDERHSRLCGPGTEAVVVNERRILSQAAAVEHNRSHNSLEDVVLCLQRKIVLPMGECGMDKINPASVLFGALTVCEEKRLKVFELGNISGLKIQCSWPICIKEGPRHTGSFRFARTYNCKFVSRRLYRLQADYCRFQ